MKIAVISAQVFVCPPPGYSGLEQIAWYIAKGLAELGHDVALIAPDGSFCPGAKVIPSGPAGTWSEAQAYDKYWKELLSFDAIIDHSWSKFSYILKSESKLKAPVLGVMHAPVNTMYQTLPPVEKPCIVCISKDQANHFEALFSRPARVAYNGINLEYYKSTGARRTRRFLFLARFSSIKGADLAIEACRRTGAGLDLVGDTSITNEPEYFAKCKEACDGEQIRMVGPASRGECVHWFSQAWAMLHPNMRFREPFGLAPVEAMACGCPVIAWDNGAMRETLDHPRVGWLVRSMEDFVNAVGASQNLTEADSTKCRKDCRERAALFSVERMATRYAELCKEALEGGGW